METTMRKILLALGAAAVLGAVALAPSAASAKGFPHHFHGHGFGLGFWGPGYVETECYLVRKPIRHGYKLIQICE
jgi:hypothetical protein